jgi:predicted GIY-YIG superfamily endonuclease
MKTYYLYYLIDPNSNEVRYVGITYRPKKRLNEHIYESLKLKTHKDKWINKLLNNGQKPIFKIVLETNNKDEILQHEINNISELTNLTNSTSGGEYFTFTPDVINKIKEKNRGSNNPNYGKKWNEEQRNKQSLKYQHRAIDENWKNNLSKSCKNKKQIIINGITYPSISNAAKKLGISWDMAKKFATK